MKDYTIMIGGADFMVSSIISTDVGLLLIQEESRLTPYQEQSAEELFVVPDLLSFNDIEAYAQNLISQYSVKSLVCFTEYGLAGAAKIAHQHGLKTNCMLEAVDITRDKLKARECTNALSAFEKVSFSYIKQKEDLIRFFDSLGRPVILKPLDGVGSKGVYLINTLSDIDEAIDHTRLFSNDLIAEEFIEGDEYSVESISLAGKHELLNVTLKETSGAPNFVELGHLQPAQLNSELLSNVEVALFAFLENIGHETGPCHTEIKIHEGLVYFIESHTRPGGDNIWEMTHLTTGCDLFKETIISLHQQPIEKRAISADFACVRFFAFKEGMIRTINAPPINDKLNVHRAVVNAKAGDFLSTPLCSNQRSGFVLSIGKTAVEAKYCADNFISSIDLEYAEQ